MSSSSRRELLDSFTLLTPRMLPKAAWSRVKTVRWLAALVMSSLLLTWFRSPIGVYDDAYYKQLMAESVTEDDDPYASSSSDQGRNGTRSIMSGYLYRFDVDAPSGSQVLEHRDVLTIAFATTLHHGSIELDNDIAVYCLDDDAAQPIAVDVDDYIDLVSTRRQRKGSVRVGPIVNMRCAWQFRFLTSDRQVLGTSPIFRMVHGPTQPLQLRLALTAHAREMRVSWTSAAVETPEVRYGSQQDALDRSVTATAGSYSASDMCGEPATQISAQRYRDPGQLFSAVLKDLTPGETYFYTVGARNGTRSEIHELVVPPEAGSNNMAQRLNGSEGNDTMSFFVLGNLGTPTTATGEYAVPWRSGATMELMERDTVDNSTHTYVAAMHLGDLSYAQGRTFAWDQFGLLIERVASKIAYLIAMGNHEYGFSEGREVNVAKFPSHPLLEQAEENGNQANGECGVPTIKRFIMPENGHDAFWYSTDMGLVHHTIMTAELDFAVGSTQYQWLQQDLAQVDRTKTPWLMLHVHRPMYSSEDYDQDQRVSLLVREHIEPLAVKYGVNVVFAAHFHAYERTCAVNAGVCVDTETDGSLSAHAPVHIMVGSAGALRDTADFLPDTPWSVVRTQQYGYGRMHIYNTSHALFEFVTNEDGRVWDSVWIHAAQEARRGNVRVLDGFIVGHRFGSDDVSWEAERVVFGGLAAAACAGALIMRRRWWGATSKPRGYQPV